MCFMYRVIMSLMNSPHTGNHELWVRPSDTAKNSLQKFEQILNLCKELGICTSPKKVQSPHFMWY
jgi:hypothetical protein